MKKMQGDVEKMKVDQNQINKDMQNVQNQRQRSLVHEQVQRWQADNADRVPRQHTESVEFLIVFHVTVIRTTTIRRPFCDKSSES